MKHYLPLWLALLTGFMQSSASILNEIATTTFGEGNVHATAWLTKNGTNYNAYAGYDKTGNGNVRLATFNAETSVLTTTHEKEFSYSKSIVNHLAWVDAGSQAYLAAGGFTNNQGKEIAIFRLVPSSNSFSREYRKSFNDSNNEATVYTVAWVTANETHYLAVGGDDDNGGKEIRLYALDMSSPSDPVLDELPNATGSFYHGEVRASDFTTVDGTIYLAAGGNEIASIRSEIKIYAFDPDAGTLTLLETGSMNSGTANAVKFHEIDGTVYLAAGGNDAGENAEIRIFTFDTDTNTLTMVAQASFNNGVVYSVSWGELNGEVYLVASGDDGSESEEIRVYHFDADTNTLTATGASASFNNGIVYGSSFHSIDSDLYLAAGGDDSTNDEPFRIYQLTQIV